MGLYVSHNAFNGAYSAFNRMRQEVARAMGGSYPPHNEFGILVQGFKTDRWYWGPGYSRATHPGLWEFFCHSDCDGNISPEMCANVADELEALLPKIRNDLDWGHIERAGGYREAVRSFIAGCRAAAAADEPLEFG
jgi:hypothetical protein